MAKNANYKANVIAWYVFDKTAIMPNIIMFIIELQIRKQTWVQLGEQNDKTNISSELAELAPGSRCENTSTASSFKPKIKE